jgi:hypothetical protein
MALALALAAAPTPPPALSAAQEEEIVVRRRKLDTWRGSARFKKGRHQCKTKTSSGDPALDRIACGAMTQCMGELQPKVDAVASAGSSGKQRKELLRPIYAELGQCIKAAHTEGLRRLAAEEEASRTE